MPIDGVFRERGRPVSLQATILDTLPLACCLLPEHSETTSDVAPGEFVLINNSSAAVEIPYNCSPLQYLNLLVRDESGALVSTYSYGEIFSPGLETCLLRLNPGERFTHRVSLLGTVGQPLRRGGRYTITAVYHYDGMKAVSAPITVATVQRGVPGSVLPGATEPAAPRPTA